MIELGKWTPFFGQRTGLFSGMSQRQTRPFIGAEEGRQEKPHPHQRQNKQSSRSGARQRPQSDHPPGHDSAIRLSSQVVYLS